MKLKQEFYLKCGEKIYMDNISNLIMALIAGILPTSLVLNFMLAVTNTDVALVDLFKMSTAIWACVLTVIVSLKGVSK